MANTDSVTKVNDATKEDSEIDDQTSEELDYVIGAMFAYRENNNLPEPNDADINKAIEFYLHIKENAALYDLITDGEVMVNVDASTDNISIIATEDSNICPHCQAEAQSEEDDEIPTSLN